MSLSLRQPKVFWLVFMLEIWERYGFYTIQALVVLYLISQFNLSDGASDIMFGSFASLAYLLTSLGGWVGDRYLGTKRCIVIGAALLALGYLILSIPAISLSIVGLALCVIAIGNGFFKPNPSSLISKVYEKGQYNQDSGFTLYYMAVNMGGILGLFIAPLIQVHWGWSWAYRVAFFCLALALVLYSRLRIYVKEVGSKPDLAPLRKEAAIYISVATAMVLLLGWWMMGHEHIMSIVLTLATCVFLTIYVVQIFKAQPAEQNGMVLFLMLFVVGCVFWAFFFQMPSSILLFVVRNVHHHILFFNLQPAQYLGFESIFVVVMGPVMAILYDKLKGKRHDSISAKFAVGMLCLALSFFVIPAAGLFNPDGVISSWWMVLLYWLQAMSELLISALGFSMVSRYIPQRLMGFVMGLWLLTISMGTLFSGYIAAIASIPQNLDHNPLRSFPVYSHLFSKLGWIALAISLLLFVCLPLLNKLSDSKG